ncbi:MAG: DNA replication and repair protein RecF [Candidatus Berkelbacteria bacterium Licking1014_7]|uniref:DNA replication and repair protein RecF n=1 Tax=Candidatus Berkelbacteria bacterium Licking1014_7 TaxID=2017147 RepID=A0A554LJ35_9BACT|nr:MAG: DNA replication and repair protein RecF [Candidatus Berkelbacteria bacterium Licking1014_7]
MKLLSLRLQNFRNYTDFVFEPDGLTVLVGKNGVGKTNIIEAIRFLTIFKSYRSKKQIEVIKWSEDWMRLEGRAKIANKNRTLEMYQDKTQKVAKIDKVNKNITQMIGLFRSVLFAPEDLSLVQGAPGLRRKWWDIVLSQKDRKYLKKLVMYYKVLKNRNHLLLKIFSGLANQDELDYWDNQLVENGEFLQKTRRTFTEHFNKSASHYYHTVSSEQQNLQINLKIKDISLPLLKERLNFDIKMRATTAGPHLDDFYFELGGRDLATFGSRGEFRSVILVSKIIEADFLREENDLPVILLDDILSELDQKRRNHLFEMFGEHQVIMTTTDAAGIEEKVRKGAKIVELN